MGEANRRAEAQRRLKNTDADLFIEKIEAFIEAKINSCRDRADIHDAVELNRARSAFKELLTGEVQGE